MKINFTFLSCILLTSISFGQTIEKFSIDSGGQSISTGNIQMLYTIGEVNVQELSVGNIQISEGFINPDTSTTLSIGNEFSFGIKIFPNPATSLITIQSNIRLEKVEIYDIIGKQVFMVNSELNFIDVSKLSKGSYLLIIKTNEGEVTKKIIIN